MNQHSKQRFYFTDIKVSQGMFRWKNIKKRKVLLGMYYFSQMTRLYRFFI